MTRAENLQFNASTQEYQWNDGKFSEINAIEVGTPCLRYLVRQPDDHRDVDDLEKGEYSFGAFGFRKDIGGVIQQMTRDKLSFGGNPLIAYCPDLKDPFGMDFFGITCPGLFNYEILDRFQQKLSLVGVAHLHLHASNLRGAIIVSFNGDGSLRYIEAKSGQRSFHDSILLFEDRVEFKVGSQLNGIRRKGKEIFGVPKWAFSEDISSKVVVRFASESEDPILNVKRNLPNKDQMRFGHPLSPGQFSNRQIGTEVEVVMSEGQLEAPFVFAMESATLGRVNLKLSVNAGTVRLELSDQVGENRYYMQADRSLLGELSKNMQTLLVGELSQLSVNIVSDYSEYLFLYLHQLLSARKEEGISLRQ